MCVQLKTDIEQFTVAPAITAACVVLAVAYSSDHFQERGFHMVPVLTLSLIGYIILMVVDMHTQKALAYFAIFLCTIGVSPPALSLLTHLTSLQAYPVSTLYSAWMLSNINNLDARALTMGVLLSLSKSSHSTSTVFQA
jgi:hypothetical protein